MAKTHPHLAQLEKLFAQAGYRVRYEAGSFKTDICIVESKNQVVVNKYLLPPARATLLAELWGRLTIHDLVLKAEGEVLAARVK